MSVHYKFKSALDFDTITFDGLHISVFDLKKAIIHQKRLGKTADFDLQITNAQTKEEYNDDTTLIPKNTSLIIARIPLAAQPKKPWDPHNEKTQGIRQAPEPDGGSLDLSQMNGTEEDKIQAMMIQSTIDYDPNNYQKLRGQGQTGEVPANYRCFKCHKPGHWIKNCSLGSNSEMGDIKRNTGIPRSFIERDSQETSLEKQSLPVSTEKKQEIPEDLLCSMCKDLFTDAVMIPCCGSSFCDECVRTALLESEDNECPDCKEKGSSPGSLIPNRFLRNSVNAFKNETGYSKPRPRKDQLTIKEIDSNLGIPITSTNSNPAVENTNVIPEAQFKDKKDDKSENSKEKKEEDSKSKGEVVIHSSHDEIESDFEDNITVTVPPAYLQGQKPSYIERQHIGRFSKIQKKSSIDNSPKHNQSHTSPPASEQKSGTPTVDEKDNISEHLPDPSLKHNNANAHHAISRDPVRSHRAAPADIYGGGSPMTPYPPVQSLMLPSRPYEMGSYGVPPGPPYVPFIMGDNMRGPYHPPRPGYPPMHQIRPRHIPPPGILASVYQGVAAKVGTGIIDDPLEAFNRIMREKEKRKEERRRSPNRRRSRSIELNIGRSRPVAYNRPRARSPEERRQRSPLPRERRGRSRERDKRSIENDKRRHQSSSFSDRSSRSRSWSIPPRRRTKSPLARRRSRSRSPSFSMARYRPKDSRRIERREDFSREEFRDRSPYHHHQSRRARSRGRILSPMQHRQSRMSGHNQDILSHQVAPLVMYNEGLYSHNNRYNRGIHGPPSRKELCSRERNDYQSEIFDEEPPPGTDEPPPPGFENSPHRDSRNRNQFDDRGCRSDYYELDNKISYNERGQAADLRDIQSLESDMCIRIDGKEREGRSWSRTSPNIVRNFDKRRRSCSRSPLRGDRFVEHFQNRDLNTNRERFINRDRHSAERHGNERERVEQERRRERSIRERKSPKIKSEEIERKVHEKETRHINRDEKYREKHKESEKDKKQESSEDEKKDKKFKEKKKKKRDPEKKKNKKEKKEKKEKEKEKEQENVNINEFLIEKNIEERQVNDEKQELVDECIEKIRRSPLREDEKLADDKDVGTQLLECEQIDLYGDICQDDKINLDYSNIVEQEDIHKTASTIKSSPMDMKRFDSVLDIHDFEPDLDDIAKDEVKKEVGVLVPIPELSKWEREEENQMKEEKKITLSNDPFSLNDEKSGKVTNEVIRRAENAIFARAINAIRPIEIKKISLERQKLYSNESTKEISPPISVMVKTQSPGKEITSFQITVPANSNFSERSVEIKSDKQKRSPIRSVKDRLGSKIMEPTNKRNRSRSTTPIRKVTLECNRIEKARLARSKSKDRYRGENIREQSDKASEMKRIHDNREREKNIKEYKIIELSRSRDQTRNREQLDRRGHGQNRLKDRSWDQERYREKERDKEKEKGRRRKSVDRGRERYAGDSKFKERNKFIEHDKLRNRGQKRDRSRSKSVDKKEKKIKREKENKRKHSEEAKSQEREKKVQVGKIEPDCKEKVSQNKKTGLNENNCDQENGEQTEKKDKDKAFIDDEKDKLKTPDSNKRSHNPSSKSSTSSSSDSESDSNLEERKRKKRKYKKEKKRAKRASSAESSSTTKRKRSKSKKKSKSSKKKKKGKK